MDEVLLIILAPVTFRKSCVTRLYICIYIYMCVCVGGCVCVYESISLDERIKKMCVCVCLGWQIPSHSNIQNTFSSNQEEVYSGEEMVPARRLKCQLCFYLCSSQLPFPEVYLSICLPISAQPPQPNETSSLLLHYTPWFKRREPEWLSGYPSHVGIKQNCLSKKF